MQKVTIIIFLVFFGISTKAQPNLDSLHSVWQDEAQSDSIRVEAYYDFIWKGFIFSQPDTAFILADELLAYGLDKNYLNAQALAYNIQGVSMALRGNNPKALDYFTLKLIIQEQIGDQSGMAGSLQNIGNIYKIQGDYPKALDYYTQCLKIQEQIGNQKGIADCLQNLGINYFNQADYHKALGHFTRSLRIQKQIGDQRGIATSFQNMGSIYQRQGDYPKALDYFINSLKIKEQLNDQIGISGCLQNIGIIYKTQGDFPQALDYLTRSLKIQEEIGDQEGTAHSNLGIGIVYRNLGDYPKALHYYTISLKIQEKIGNQGGIADCLHSIGDNYFDQGDYSQALDYYTKSLKLQDQIGDQLGVASALSNIGGIYQVQGNNSKALNYCQNSYDLAKTIGSLQTQKSSCTCLYDTYKAMGIYNKALEYHELLNVIEDSLLTVETAKKLQQIEFQKQVFADSLAGVEQARLIQEKHDQEVRQKNQTRNIFIVISILILFLAAGVYNRLRFVRKSNAIIEKEKERSENLLLNILPAEIAEELKEKGRADARDFDLVSILFSDFKDFTEQSAKLSAADLVTEINHCFEAFDGIMEKHDIEKIKTIGDAYMAAGGLPVPKEDSVKNTILAALEMQAFISNRKAEMDGRNLPTFEMRVGIHTGPVVAGIVGVKKFQYDIWGDTVNTASRMESNGDVRKVNIGQTTYELIKGDPQFSFESRGKIDVKGKGEVEMWFVSMKTENE